MIRTFVFDMGNVLLHFSHERMCAQIADVGGRPTETVRELLFPQMQPGELCVDFECGRIGLAAFRQRVEEGIGRRLSPRRFRRALCDIFELNEPMPPVLAELKRQGRLVLLSNTNEAHFAHVQRRFGELLALFDEFVLSCRVGAMKPATPIFEALLAAIDCEPDRCFYTDDIAEYVEKARGFGLHADVFIDTTTLLGQLRQRNVHLELSAD